MSNPILQALRGTQAPINPMASNPIQMIQQFAQFKRSMQGKNPQAIVQELLNSGQMSQEQFEQLKQQAQDLQSILK